MFCVFFCNCQDSLCHFESVLVRVFGPLVLIAHAVFPVLVSVKSSEIDT